MSKLPHLCIILGIRPDVIRASIFLNLIREDPRIKVTFIWSGQHYSDNLKVKISSDSYLQPKIY